jgi:hypothetical protein
MPQVRASRRKGVTTVELEMEQGTPAKVTVTAYVDGVPQGLTYDIGELADGESQALEPIPAPTAPHPQR